MNVELDIWTKTIFAPGWNMFVFAVKLGNLTWKSMRIELFLKPASSGHFRNSFWHLDIGFILQPYRLPLFVCICSSYWLKKNIWYPQQTFIRETFKHILNVPAAKQKKCCTWTKLISSKWINSEVPVLWRTQGTLDGTECSADKSEYLSKPSTKTLLYVVVMPKNDLSSFSQL